MLSMLIVPMALGLAVIEPPQSVPRVNSLYQGAKSIGFALPSPGLAWRNTGLNGTYMLTDHWALTLGLGASFNREEVLNTTTTGVSTFANYNVSLLPGARYYFAPHKSLTPWVGGALMGTYERRPQNNTAGQPTDIAFDNGSLSVLGRFGAEWFIVPQVSISGELGLAVQAICRDYLLAPRIETFHSQLVGSFYW